MVKKPPTSVKKLPYIDFTYIPMKPHLYFTLGSCTLHVAHPLWVYDIIHIELIRIPT
jgi:hypothetical protein